MNTITLVATDAAGNATTVVRSVTLDTTAPVLTVSTPTDGTTVPDDNITVAGTATDQSAVHVAVNGAAVALASGGAFSTSIALVSGANTIAVIATDSVGNSTTVSRQRDARGGTRSESPTQLHTKGRWIATEWSLK